MERLACILLSVAVVACDHGTSVKSTLPEEQEASVRVSARSDAAGVEKESVVEPTIEQVQSTIDRTYPDRIPRTQKQLGVVSFVEKYLDAEKRPLPRLQKYLIDQPSEGHWIVTLLDLELLQQGGRGGSLSVYVDENNGQLKVTKVTIGT